MAIDYSQLYKFAPGTPTLGARELTEKGRQFDVGLQDTQQARQAEALLAAKDFQEKRRQFDLTYGLDRRNTEYNTNRPYFEPDRTKQITPVNKASIEAADALIQDMYDAKARMGKYKSPTYNYNWHITKAQNQGYWNNLDRADQLRVMKTMQDLTGIK